MGKKRETIREKLTISKCLNNLNATDNKHTQQKTMKTITVQTIVNDEIKKC